MGNEIIVDGLDYDVVQKITGIKLINARQVERTGEGMKFGVQVTLLNNGAPLGNRKVRTAIQENTFASWDELNAGAQASYGKDFVDLTVVESQQVQGEVLAGKMITAINEANAGISVDDVTALVTAIVTALA